MKTDLLDLTFLIPIRLDSIVRLEYALATIDYLYKSFNTTIIVLEASKHNNKIIHRLVGRKRVDDKIPMPIKFLYYAY
jgi:hypothetical protein